MSLIATPSFLETFQDCIRILQPIFNWKSPILCRKKVFWSVIVLLFSTGHVLPSFKRSGVSTWAIHGCISLSAAGNHRYWARSGASLRQQCSRYLAAVAADYPFNSPLSANRKSSIISFLHSQLSFCGCFPSGQCFRFPVLYLLQYSHLQPLSLQQYYLLLLWSLSPSSVLQGYPCAEVPVLPHSLSFSVLLRKRSLTAAAGVWTPETQNGVKSISSQTQFLQAKNPPMGNTE